MPYRSAVTITNFLESNKYQLPYFLKSLLAFIGFHNIGLLLLHFTLIGSLYTMPQWVFIGAFTNFLFLGEWRPRGDWYWLGTILYACAGLIFGLIFNKAPRRWHRWSIAASIFLFQLIIYTSIVVLSLMGVWSPLDGW